MAPFRFKKFSVDSDGCGLKVGTDGVLLGAAASLDFLYERCNGIRVLDVGTGSGLIALMLAQRIDGLAGGASVAGISGWNIIGIDIDCAAAVAATTNFSASPWAGHLESRHLALADLDDGVYDLIVSNPPYYDSGLVSPVASRAVARSVNGLSYRELTAFAAEHLAPGGQLSLILPQSDEKSALRYAASFGLFPVHILQISTTPAKLPSRVILEFVAGSGGELLRSALVINEGNGYSDAYRQLTADFYL